MKAPSHPKQAAPASSPGAAGKGLNPAVQKHIGNLLKVAYQDVLAEPVPSRFTELLNALGETEKKGGKNGK